MKCYASLPTCAKAVWSTAFGLACCLATGLTALAAEPSVPATADPPATTGAGRILAIREKVSVHQEKVLLADLVVSADLLSSGERALAVLDAPAPGESRRLPLIDLAFALQRFPALLDLQLQGGDTVVIERAGDAAELLRTKEKVLAFLRATAPWSGWKTDVLFQAEDERKLKWPTEAASVDIRPLDNTAVLGKVPLRLAFLDSRGVRLLECNLAPVILRETKALVMATSRERGWVLRADDVQTMPLWTGGDENRTTYITDTESCVGRELSRAMAAGDLLQPKFLLNPVCVKRGDIVWIECKSGGLAVQLSANAMEGGRLGESVRVRNPVSGKEFQAKITGDRKAAVDLSPGP